MTIQLHSHYRWCPNRTCQSTRSCPRSPPSVWPSTTSPPSPPPSSPRGPPFSPSNPRRGSGTGGGAAGAAGAGRGSCWNRPLWAPLPLLLTPPSEPGTVRTTSRGRSGLLGKVRRALRPFPDFVGINWTADATLVPTITPTATTTATTTKPKWTPLQFPAVIIALVILLWTVLVDFLLTLTRPWKHRRTATLFSWRRVGFTGWPVKDQYPQDRFRVATLAPAPAKERGRFRPSGTRKGKVLSSRVVRPQEAVTGWMLHTDDPCSWLTSSV